jgi:hypothetical protein
MKLALRLGRTLGELKRSMSVSEFREWLAFNHLSPIGDERADVLHAIGAYASVKPHTRRGSSLKVGDFVPKWSEEQKRQNLDNGIAHLLMSKGIKPQTNNG